MKNSIFSISLLCLFLLASCNNQPAKRQNQAEISKVTNESNEMSAFHEQEATSAEEKAENTVTGSDVEMAKMSKGVVEGGSLEKISAPDKVESSSMSAEERERAREAALEKRRQREEAQRARAIARAEQTGDQATIRQEASRTSTAAIQEKNKPVSADDLLPESTKKQVEKLKKKNNGLLQEKEGLKTTATNATPAEEANSPVVDHSDWDYLLRKYVSKTGKVDYAGLKADSKALDKYLKQLRNYPPAKSWSREEKMAYWINAYNAFTVKLILDNYPLSSITKLEGGKPWDKAWITIGGESYTLNNIENDILRPSFKDSRIHFAVNCAAASCPPLLNRAWTAENQERHFQNQTRAFINNDQYNTISANKIEVSKIFEWYATDFGNLIDFLNQYSNKKINAGAKVTYKEYDWELND